MAQKFQLPTVVALNRFATDTAEELDLVAAQLAEQGVACAPCNGWAEGGKGTTELAKLVCEAADANPAPVPSYTYPDEVPLKDKILTVATRIYHAAEVSFAPQALKDLAQLEADGYGACPVCIAKTQYSMSDDASRLGAPEGYTLTIRSAQRRCGIRGGVCGQHHRHARLAQGSRRPWHRCGRAGRNHRPVLSISFAFR